MIEHVFDRCVEADVAFLVEVATPDWEIWHKHGLAQTTLIEDDCLSGSDRVAKAAEGFKPHVRFIINVQGDMPFIEPEHIRKIAQARWASKADVVTAYARTGFVDYASEPLSFDRRVINSHIGVYAFTAESLKRFAQSPRSQLEDLLSLEQWRMVEAGLSIEAVELPSAPLEVNTPEDVARINAIRKSMGHDAPHRIQSVA